VQSERFAGGILAVANHMAAFAGQVTVLTVLGQQDGRPDPSEAFVRANLNPAIIPEFLYQEGAPTLTKRRYVEQYPLQKLFEVYFMKHMEEDGPEAGALCARLEALLGGFDLVVVVDYGHGMIGSRAVQLLCSRARFLAVNTQSNADNQGFNTISKYSRADFISLSEKELRLEARSRIRETTWIMKEVAAKLGCRSLLVTRGKAGNLLWDHREPEVLASPNLSAQVVDRVGAGDAVLSVASLCVALGAPADTIGFLGNVVGAQAVATVGHRQSLDREQLVHTINALLG
jgi:bifunctional ADP-heptose synthase (sugar kinase/adenylyltransferase)